VPKYALPVKTPSVRFSAALAVLVAGLVFVPAALAAPAPTKLSLTGPKRAPGGVTTLTAELTTGGKGLPGREIALYAGGATPIATGAGDANGRIAFEVTIIEPTRFQASYTPAPADAAAYLAAKSKTLGVVPTAGINFAAGTYLHAGRRSVGIPHTTVRIGGTVARYSPGAGITIDVFKDSKRVKHRAVGIRRAGSRGAFSFSFKPGGRGVYRVRASSPAGSRTIRVFVVAPHAGQGSRGTAVRALQSRLRQLGYLTPVNGYFDASTGRAVLAFRKVNGYTRTSSASLAVFKKLARGGGGYRVRYPSAGKHVEFDWSRQVLVLTRGANPQKIVPASSGKPSTPTVFGKFHFYSKTPGFNSHGMYYSNYFIGGYAIHGYESVPDYAASHGCIRIPIPSAIAVYRWISLGNAIYVYR
jgi:hypothetical protein